MVAFKAGFRIIDSRNCPFYGKDEVFTLSDKAVRLPLAKPSCLILVRELTGLLFSLLPHVESDFATQRETIFSCGGCTGLIKFRLTDVPADTASSYERQDSVISGRLDLISTAELLQIFHMHQKTGKLIFELESGSARITFRDGALIAARYNEFDNQQAIFCLLGQDTGYFHFEPGLSPELSQAREIGDFMTILMEGLKRLDENKE